MRKSEKSEEPNPVPAPVVTIKTTETVRLDIPGGYGYSDGAYYRQTATPSRDNLEEFVRQVHSKFGRNEDVCISIRDNGISASVTETK